METKPCVICAQPVPAHAGRVTCSMACRGIHFSRTYHGRSMAHVREGKKRAGKLRVEARAREFFGRLTPREVEIFNHAAWVGYRRGYNAKRRLKAEAA